MASVMLVAAVLMTAMEVVSRQGLTPPHGADWGWIWLVTLLPGATGHVLLAWSHRHVEAWLGSLITQCQPVVGSVAAWVLLGESLTLVTIVIRMIRDVFAIIHLVLRKNIESISDGCVHACRASVSLHRPTIA
jgi:hypothetical protein